MTNSETLTTEHEISGRDETSAAMRRNQRLLFLGPESGHIGGALSLFKAFEEVLSERPGLEVETINTAPPPDYLKASRGRFDLVNNETVSRTGRILRQFAAKIGWADRVLVFTNPTFAFALIPPMVAMARVRGKPIYLKTIGGNLDLSIANLRPPLRQYVLASFRALDGILAETQLLQASLEALGCDNVYYVPNCRSVDEPVGLAPEKDPSRAGELRVVFLSQIHEYKGIFVLLDALGALAAREDVTVACDFYGPIFPDVEDEFMTRLAATPGADYHGVLPIGAAPGVMANYDALVLPTHYIDEGHPGIIIEAMQAGVAVVSTQHRAIPELVTDGEDGILVPPKDPAALAQALAHLALNPGEVKRMGAAHAARFNDFTAEHVVNEAADLILA